jgi:hypothetical protein
MLIAGYLLLFFNLNLIIEILYLLRPEKEYTEVTEKHRNTETSFSQ